MRTAFGVFLILHAFVHVMWLLPAPADPAYPFRLEGSALLPGLSSASVKLFGSGLAIAALVAFVAAGLGVLGVAGLDGIWRVAAPIGAVASLGLLVLSWNNYFVAGPVLDIAIVVAAWLDWSG